MILPTWFDHPQESFSYEEVQLKKFANLRKPVTLLLNACKFHSSSLLIWFRPIVLANLNTKPEHGSLTDAHRNKPQKCLL